MLFLFFVLYIRSTDHLPRSYHRSPVKVQKKCLEERASDLTTLAEAQENVIDICAFVVVLQQIIGIGNQCWKDDSMISIGNLIINWWLTWCFVVNVWLESRSQLVGVLQSLAHLLDVLRHLLENAGLAEGSLCTGLWAMHAHGQQDNGEAREDDNLYVNHAAGEGEKEREKNDIMNSKFGPGPGAWITHPH